MNIVDRKPFPYKRKFSVIKEEEDSLLTNILSYRIYLLSKIGTMNYYTDKIEPGYISDYGDHAGRDIINCNINTLNNTIIFNDGSPESSIVKLFNLYEDHYILNLQKDQSEYFIRQLKQVILDSNNEFINDLCQIIAEYAIEISDSFKWTTINTRKVIVLFRDIQWNNRLNPNSHNIQSGRKGVLKLSYDITLNLYQYNHGDIHVKSIIMPLPLQ